MQQNNVGNQRGHQNPQSGRNHHNLSRNTSLQIRREEEQAAAIKKYKVGQIVRGKITHFFKAGSDHPQDSAIVQFNEGGSALLLYNELPGYPQNILSAIHAKGDEVDVEITAIRPGKGRISVSLEPVYRKVWISRLETGMVVEATITRKLNYGYFVDIASGLQALLHNDHLDITLRNQLESFNVGEKTEVAIIKIEEDGNRISVGRKELFI